MGLGVMDAVALGVGVGVGVPVGAGAAEGSCTTKMNPETVPPAGELVKLMAFTRIRRLPV